MCGVETSQSQVALCDATKSPNCVATPYPSRHCNAMCWRVRRVTTASDAKPDQAKSRTETATRVLALIREVMTLIILIAPWVTTRL